LNSLLIKLIIDSLVLASSQQAPVQIVWLAVLLVINVEVHNLYWRGMGYINYKLRPLLKSSVMSETAGRVHQYSLQFFQERLAGRIAGNITNLADNIERIVHEIVRQLLRAGVLIEQSPLSAYIGCIQHFLLSAELVSDLCGDRRQSV
jgi:ABC-type multidrug transport system fused ATPase/permease subunit